MTIHTAFESVRPLPRLLAAAVAAGLLLSGCGTAAAPTASEEPAVHAELMPLAELPLLTDPKSYVGESTAVLYDSAIEPVAVNPTQSLPVTVTSRDRVGDQPVTVTDTSRIVGLSLSGNIAATVAALGLGDNLVGRDVATSFPGLKDLPQVTKAGHALDIEALLSVNPSLVITDGTIGPLDVVLQIRDAGIPLVFVDEEPSIENVYRVTEQVAAALGVPEAGASLIERQRAEIEAKLAEIAGIAPQGDARLRMAVFYLRGGSGIYYLLGSDAGSGVLIDSLGGIDVAREIGWDGAKPMTDEALIQINPDLIIVMTSGLESAGGVDGLLEQKPAIALTAAGQHRRFVAMKDTDLLSFGPRTAGILDALARAIYSPEDQGVTLTPLAQ